MKKMGTLLAWGALVLLTTGWLVFLRPETLGGSVGYILINGESMLPRLRTGDLVLVKTATNYERGDVVVYRVPEGNLGEGVKIIHRIIGGDSRSGFVVQGDNKPHKDPWKPLPSDVVGKQWIHIPSAGTLLGVLRTPLGIATLAALFAIWIFLGSKPAVPGAGRGKQAKRKSARMLILAVALAGMATRVHAAGLEIRSGQLAVFTAVVPPLSPPSQPDLPADSTE
jgi:signal peptidase I